MKTKFRISAAIICAVMTVLSLASCAGGGGSAGGGAVGKSTILGTPQAVDQVEYAELIADDYKAYKKSVEEFAADFAEYSYLDYSKQDNFAVSPISVYMALALSAECAAGDTRREILDALGATYEQLKTHFSTLYRSLSVERKVDGATTGLLNLTNSIWVNEGTKVKQSCIDGLSNDFYAYSYSADFAHDNAAANRAVRDFVKEQTKGLIDKDFRLSTNTLFTLINTLYLKTIWDTDRDELPFAEDSYRFTAKDGSVKDVRLLQGDYLSGRAVEFDTFTTFYTSTYDGYKIKFILPKDGYTTDDVFSADNIAEVNSATDGRIYDSQGTQYMTRVLFPEYKCKYDEDIKEILRDKFNIDLFFKDSSGYSPACDFSTLSDEPCYCSKVQHVTDLTVNRKGIEGAAVTAVSMDAASAPPVVTVKEDFIVNKAFGFIITDRCDITLFSGVVNNI